MPKENNFMLVFRKDIFPFKCFHVDTRCQISVSQCV